MANPFAPQNESNTARTTNRRSIAISALGGLIAGLAVFLLTSHPANSPTAKPRPIPDVKPVIRRDVVRAAFFDAQVQPQIQATDALNRKAADRCIKRLEAIIDGYREGVEPFTEDLTSVSTRLGIVRRLPGNWWKGDKRVERFVEEKFEKHLFSKESLTEDVAGALNGFRDEVDANQKRMLTSIQASLDTADLPEVELEAYEPFFEAVATNLKTFSAEQGTSSVHSGLSVLVASEAGTLVTMSVVSGLLTRFGPAAAASAAAGAGATAGTTAAGGSGGSLAGPAGTVVGLGIGLAVGLGIDWWMTGKFQEQMTTQMNEYLDSLQHQLLHGSTTSNDGTSVASLAPEGGITEGMPLVCDRLSAAYRDRFFQQIVTMDSPR